MITIIIAISVSFASSAGAFCLSAQAARTPSPLPASHKSGVDEIRFYPAGRPASFHPAGGGFRFRGAGRKVMRALPFAGSKVMIIRLERGEYVKYSATSSRFWGWRGEGGPLVGRASMGAQTGAETSREPLARGGCLRANK